MAGQYHRRKCYVEYEIRARMANLPARTTAAQRKRMKDRVTRESMAGWRQLLPWHRELFIDDLNDVNESRQIFAELRDWAEDELTRINNEVVNGEAQDVDWPNEIRAMADLADSHEVLIEAQGGLLEDFRAFRRTVEEVYTNQVVRQYAAGQLRDEELELTRFRRRRDNMRNYANHPPIPRRPDGMKIIPEYMLPEHKRMREGEVIEADRRKARDQNDTHIGKFREGVWMGMGAVGVGGQSTNSLWIRADDDGKICERIVKKDVFFARRDWADATRWDGDVHDSNNRSAMEFACHRALERIHTDPNLPDDNVNVPKLYRGFVNNKMLRITLYIEYCGFGDLNQLIERHRDSNSAIPEPFLWYTFWSLSKVGLAMERGTTNETKERLPDWDREIVHRDLKPSNIFLDESTDVFFEIYPTPKVADFGHAIKTSEKSKLNPEIYLDQGGTEGFIAPEQLAYVDYHTLRPLNRWKLLSKTNVFGVGMILYALAALEPEPGQPMWLGDGSNDRHKHDAFQDCPPEYSEDLKKLINNCIEFNPANRPTFEEIINTIDDAIKPDGKNLARDKGDLSRDDAEIGEPDYVIDMVDAYRKGLALRI